MISRLNRQQVLDLYFLEARSKLLELAAFLDRVDCAPGEDDFRVAALREAMKALQFNHPDRAEKVLLALSDPTTEPIPQAPGKGAVGAWPGVPASTPAA